MPAMVLTRKSVHDGEGPTGLVRDVVDVEFEELDEVLHTVGTKHEQLLKLYERGVMLPYAVTDAGIM